MFNFYLDGAIMNSWFDICDTPITSVSHIYSQIISFKHVLILNFHYQPLVVPDMLHHCYSFHCDFGINFVLCRNWIWNLIDTILLLGMVKNVLYMYCYCFCSKCKRNLIFTRNLWEAWMMCLNQCKKFMQLSTRKYQMEQTLKTFSLLDLAKEVSS